MNKIDLLPAVQRDSLLNDAKSVYISAAKDIGIGTLLERIDEMLSEDALSRIRVRVPQEEGKILAMLEARSRIYSRRYDDGSVELDVEAPASVVRKVRKWLVD
jgi:GTP-binding protein HflX